MRAFGPLNSIKIDGGQCTAKVNYESHNAFKSFIKKRLANNNDKKMVGRLEFSCEIAGTSEGGNIHLAIFEPTLDLEIQYNIHTRANQNTFYGIARFIAWAQNGHKPTPEDLFWIVEALVDRYSPTALHPIRNVEEPLRPGDPRLDTRGMAMLIEGAMNELAEQEIPDYVIHSIGPDLKKLWKNWYEWRYSQGENDPLFDDEKRIEWKEYQKWHPVCEFSGVNGVEGNPLERMHIVSAGSDIADYEQSWNWIRALRSIHKRQHDKGWSAVLKEYPHLKGKVERARRLAQKRGLEVDNV